MSLHCRFYSALMLDYLSLSNAKRFHLSMGNPSGVRRDNTFEPRKNNDL